MSQPVEHVNFVGRVVGAASQGAAGALVAAALSSVTEPVVNRVLVNRMSLSEAVALVDVATVQRFFNTTVTTNFIKFPFFEVVNMMLGDVDLPGTQKGALLGAVFTTFTLPITNYRYCQSVGLPVDMGGLYKAYLPTVLRDIVYGICRNSVSAALLKARPDLANSAKGRFVVMFLTVLASCVISAPGNEVRGYYLQPEEKRLPVNEFFKPERFVRSTAIGGLIMSTALGVGTLATGPATEIVNGWRAFLNKHPVAKVMIALFVAQQWLETKRHQEAMAKQAQLLQTIQTNKSQ
mmetsp:Transcript_23954/g.44464  ORF Transcript_23954/g.44464 Transcript_23954/m.44464 type:complete len:293 (+) Transcript_23954:128-1006(+)